jgi:hypothetical protein
LKGKPSEIWQEAVQQLHEANFVDGDVNEKIFSRLKISYDGLGEWTKRMFLDVACFMLEWPTDKALLVWKGSVYLHQRITRTCITTFLFAPQHVPLSRTCQDSTRC